MELPESTQQELEGLSEADRFKAVMGRLVRVTPEQLRAQEQREQESRPSPEVPTGKE